MESSCITVMTTIASDEQKASSNEIKVYENVAHVDGKWEESDHRPAHSFSESPGGEFHHRPAAPNPEDMMTNFKGIATPPVFCFESAERKQYTEREITYNLLLRKLVDEFMDRTITYSHQPKQVLNAIQSVLERNFPEFGYSFHRERICAYLKACRRNAKKKQGEPLVRMSARYLSAGMATRMAEQIYLREREALGKFLGIVLGSSNTLNSTSFAHCSEPATSMQSTAALSTYPSTSVDLRTNGEVPAHMKNIAESLTELGNPGQKPQPGLMGVSPNFSDQCSQGMAELALARMLTQTAEFLLLTANRIEAGQSLFPGSTTQ